MRKNITRPLLLALCLLALGTGANAQTANDFSGSVALPFIRICRDAATAGMGFTGSASTSSVAYSAFTNSAMLPFAERKLSAGLSFQGWAPDGEKNTNLAFGSAFRFGDRFGISIGAALQNGEEYEIFDQTGSMRGTDRTKDLLVGLGFGCRIAGNLSAGVNLKYAGETLAGDVSLSAFAADVFLAYKWKGLNVTAGVSSVGTSVSAASGDSFSLPSSASVGAAYDLAFSEKHGLNFALDADCFFNGGITAALGAEYSFADMVFARAGYHYGSSTAVLPSFVTVGLGARFVGIDINFAYLTGNEVLGNTLTIGIGYSF
ncbi:MAG: PorV/PorQ family protein [Candidatus Cryptobacteroides sp.]